MTVTIGEIEDKSIEPTEDIEAFENKVFGDISSEGTFDATDFWTEEELAEMEERWAVEPESESNLTETVEEIVEAIFAGVNDDVDEPTGYFADIKPPAPRAYIPPKFEDIHSDKDSSKQDRDLNWYADDLAHRFGLDYKTYQPTMFNSDNLDYEITHEILSLAAAKLFVEKNNRGYLHKYREDSPVKAANNFKDFQKKLRKIAFDHIEYPYYCDERPSADAVAVLLKEYEHVGLVKPPSVDEFKLGFYLNYGGYSIGTTFKKDWKNLVNLYSQAFMATDVVNKVIEILERENKHTVLLIDVPVNQQAAMFRDCLHSDMKKRCGYTDFDNRFVHRLINGN